jgi:hypothetical protein
MFVHQLKEIKMTLSKADANVMLEASRAAYKYGLAVPILLGGFAFKSEFTDNDTGLHVQFYQHPTTKEIIVAFEGTNPTKGSDILTDINLGKTQWTDRNKNEIFYPKKHTSNQKSFLP